MNDVDVTLIAAGQPMPPPAPGRVTGCVYFTLSEDMGAEVRAIADAREHIAEDVKRRVARLLEDFPA